MNNQEEAIYKFTRSLPDKVREKSKDKLIELIDAYGPVVETYPSWHPMLAHQDPNSGSPRMVPDELCGYHGLDHTIFMKMGFITCPYHGQDEVIESVYSLPIKPDADWSIEAERLKFPLYSPDTPAILVTCEWSTTMLPDRTIPLRIAAGLLLEMEVPGWREAQRGETWETMRNFFLGTPCGKRSSLFVNEVTGQGLKKLWAVLNAVGLFGPLKDR